MCSEDLKHTQDQKESQEGPGFLTGEIDWKGRGHKKENTGTETHTCKSPLSSLVENSRWFQQIDSRNLDCLPPSYLQIWTPRSSR